MRGDTFIALGLDVGGTKIAAGVVQFPAGELMLRKTVPTNPHRGGAPVLNDVAAVAQDLIVEAGKAGSTVDGIGLGVCELVDTSGNILSSATLRWHDQPVRERLAQFAPLTVEADVRAAARAEALFGAAKNFRTFLYVTIGTGISSCLVIDRKPFTGARGLTGTIASGPGSQCARCGEPNVQTLEERASGPGLVVRYNDRKRGAAKSSQDVLGFAANGDSEAIAVVQAAANDLGTTLGLLVNTLDPEAIVIGGGLGLSGGLYWETLVKSTRRSIWSPIHRALPILPAATSIDAGVIGAAACAWEARQG